MEATGEMTRMSGRQGKIIEQEINDVARLKQRPGGGSAGGSFILTAIAGWCGSVEISKDKEKYVVAIAKKCTTAQ